METQAQVKSLLETEAVADEPETQSETETLLVELDAIPGAVWQMELHSAMPAHVRVSLFERGAQKCALLRFPRGQGSEAYEAFDAARQTANDVSREVYQAARRAREQAERGS